MSPRSKYWGNACPLSNMDRVFGRPFVKRFALCYQAIVCPVCPGCLSVTLVYCCQTVGRIKMKLGTEVGLGPDHIVLDGDAAASKKWGTAPPILSRILWPNGCMDQDATWYGSKPRPSPGYIMLYMDPAPPKKGHSTPHFSAHVYCG